MVVLSVLGNCTSHSRVSSMAARLLAERWRGRYVGVASQCSMAGIRNLRGMATASEENVAEEAAPSSWFQRIKAMFTGDQSKQSDAPLKKAASEVKAPELKAAATPAPEPSESFTSKIVNTVKAAVTPGGGGYTMETFADELKKARRAGALAKLMKGAPRGREQAVLSVLEKQENMLRALATYQTQHFEAQQKAEVAEKCGGTVEEVEEILSKYLWSKEAHNRVEKLKKEGKPLPKNFQEVEAMMGGRWKSPSARKVDPNAQISRNQLCPCGSGKKFKRCCGQTANPAA